MLFICEKCRLIPGDDGYYHTERENFIRIEFKNLNSSNSHWVVTMKNGTRHYFGNTDDSHIDAVGKNGKALVWAINKVKDINGNYYTVEYKKDTANGDYYPVKIVYTKNNNGQLNKFKEVLFTYETRVDHYPMYIPSKIDMDERLKWITVTINGNLLRKYKINYASQSSMAETSRLESIQEYGEANNSLPNVKFNWTSDSSDISQSIDILNGKDIGYSDSRYWVDFNGDGKTDYICRVGNDPNTYYYLYLSNGNGLNPPIALLNGKDIGYSDSRYWVDFNGDGKTDYICRVGNDPNTYYYLYLSNGNGLNPPIALLNGKDIGYSDSRYWVDFNGDGKTDYVCRVGNDPNTFYYLYLSNGNGLNPPIALLNGNDIGYSDSRYWVDFNGDGKTDYICRVGNDPNTYYYLYLSNGNGLNPPIALLNGNDIGDSRYWVDFNGDGKTDYICRVGNDPNTYYYLYLSNGNGLNPPIALLNGNDIGYSDSRFWMDFNRDGKTDYVCRVGNDPNTYYYLYLSNGNGLNPPIALLNGKDIGYSDSRYWIDFNGDGKTDYVCRVGNDPNTYFRVYKGTPEIINKISSIYLPSGATITPTYSPAPQVSGAINPSDSIYPNISNKSPRALVTSLQVSDGTGNNYTTNYSYNNGKLYRGQQRDETKSLGFEWTKKTNPNGSYTLTTYRQDIPYQGLIKKQKTYDSEGKLYTEIIHRYNKRQIYPAQNGYHSVEFIYERLTNTIIFNGEGGAPEQTLVEYAEYDSYGNLVKTINEGDTSIYADSTAVFIKYAVNLTDYIMAPYLVRKYGEDLDGNTFYPNLFSENYDYGLASETKNIFYDDSNSYALAEGQIGTGMLYGKYSTSGESNKTDYPDAEITYSSYDSYGNVLTVTDGLGNTGTVSYDDDYHSFPKVKTDAQGNQVETFYNDLMRPVRTRDANNKDWETEYDAFGRVVSTISPGDNNTFPTTKTEYHNAVAVNGVITSPSYVKSSVKEDTVSNGYIDSYTYFDGLGRKIQSKIESVDEAGTQVWNTTDIYYNQMGQNNFTSVSYESTTSAYTARPGKENQIGVQTEYDDMGRVIKTINTDTTYSQVFYGKKATVFVDENNHVTSRYVNGSEISEMTFDGIYNGNKTYYMNPSNYAFYNIVKTKAGIDGTTISYNDAMGQPHSIKTVTDLLGRKLNYDDPDMGIWSYTYDANGNIKTQTDAKGQVIGFEYDEINRITRKFDLSSTLVSYLYDGLNSSGIPDGTNHGFCIGRPTTITYPGGSEDYKYDERGRVISLEKIIEGKTAVISYEYDSMNRIIKEVYPDGEELTYSYNGSGSLDSVENATAHQYIYNLNYSTLGKVDSFTYGNNTETSYGYYDENGGTDQGSGEAHSFRLKSILVKNQTGEDLANTMYRYDRKDNVARKEFTDNYNGHYIELFEYDFLDRLTRAESSSNNPIDIYGTKTYFYDIQNNITAKDGNTYNYNYWTGSSPHAVQSVAGTAGTIDYLYDSNGNMTVKLLNSVLTRTINYNTENRITSISDGGSFTYDSTGERIKKTENGVATYYFFSTYEEEYEGTDKTVIKYYFANGQRVAKVSKLNAETPVTVYFHTDHLGSAVMMTDEAGNRTMSATYTPYGSDAYYAGVTDTKYKFTGQEKDPGSGLYYYGARYYDPELGRFIQPDTYLDGLNRYAYCGNNPVNYVDPTGHGFGLPAAVATFVIGYLIVNALVDAILTVLPDDVAEQVNDTLTGVSIGTSTNTGPYVDIGAGPISPGGMAQANEQEQAYNESLSYLDSQIAYYTFLYPYRYGKGGDGKTYLEIYLTDKTALDELRGVDLFYPVHGESKPDVSSFFGLRVHPITGAIGSFHTGTDIVSFKKPGSNVPIYPAHWGYVSKVGKNDNVGNYVVVSYSGANTSKPIITLYYHMKSISVSEGSFVSPFSRMGYMGDTGFSTGRHLHFEVRYDNIAVSPLLFNQQWPYKNY